MPMRRFLWFRLNVEGFSMPIKIILWLRLKGFFSQDAFYYMWKDFQCLRKDFYGLG